MKIDFRSDTVTRPTPAMLSAMSAAAVGDDVYGEDPTVNELEAYAADLFGMEAALFCASGTMTNQIGIKLHVQPGDEVICDQLSHVYQYEGGGIAMNSGAQVHLIRGENGKITAAQVKQAINPRHDVHKAWSALVSIENTVNRGGGTCYDITTLADIRKICDEEGLQYHLDGARLFNAMIHTNTSPRQYGELFHTISICLSKGLGAPVGSLLLGSSAHIQKARRIRKAWGGGMRQAGYLAAAGLYALKNHVERLQIDHDHAKDLAHTLQQHPLVTGIMPVETNIVIATLSDRYTARQFASLLAEKNIFIHPVGNQEVRFVTHLDITPEMMKHTLKILTGIQ